MAASAPVPAPDVDCAAQPDPRDTKAAHEETLCEDCGDNPRVATLFCTICKIGYCVECDAGAHVRGRKGHKRVPISQRPAFCFIHNKEVEAFCEQEQRLVCASCMTPRGECANHLQRVKGLPEAAASARAKLKRLIKVYKDEENLMVREAADLQALRAAIDTRLSNLETAVGHARGAQASLLATHALSEIKVLQEINNAEEQAETVRKAMVMAQSDAAAWKTKLEQALQPQQPFDQDQREDMPLGDDDFPGATPADLVPVAPMVAAPSAEEQRKIISGLTDFYKGEVGEIWYLVSAVWFRQWKTHTKYMWSTFDEKRMPGPKPGPIDNSTIFDSSTNTLFSNLFENTNFTLLPACAWNKLLEWYGKEAAPPIRRKAIYNSLRLDMEVEVYMTALKVYEKPGSLNPKILSISRSATGLQLKAKVAALFDVTNDDNLRVWELWNNDYYMAIKPNTTLVDQGINRTSSIGLEFKNADGTWPSDKKSASSTKSVLYSSYSYHGST